MRSPPPSAGHRDALRDGDREAEAAGVVGVITDQVDPPRCPGGHVGHGTGSIAGSTTPFQSRARAPPRAQRTAVCSGNVSLMNTPRVVSTLARTLNRSGLRCGGSSSTWRCQSGTAAPVDRQRPGPPARTACRAGRTPTARRSGRARRRACRANSSAARRPGRRAGRRRGGGHARDLVWPAGANGVAARKCSPTSMTRSLAGPRQRACSPDMSRRRRVPLEGGQLGGGDRWDVVEGVIWPCWCGNVAPTSVPWFSNAIT